jgi:predicted aldo/keto reductase-like oxidoreductase
MRLPMTLDEQAVDRAQALPLFAEALAGGVNYVDSAVGYCNQDSQRCLGEALEAWFRAGHGRDSVVVSTKNPHYDKADKATWWQNLEDSLQRLRVQHLDVYHLHSLDLKNFTEHVDGPDGLYREMVKARDQKLIRFLAFSWHDPVPENILKVIETGLFDSMTVQYNLLSRTNEKALELAHAKGLGTVVMGPVGGGKLAVTRGPLGEGLPRGIATTPELALRFVLANPNVSVALSGMTCLADVRENLRTAALPVTLSAAERAEVEAAMARLKKLADLYCTGCRYCEPCPQGVPIADLFYLANLDRVYGSSEAARRSYAFIKKSRAAKGKPMAEGCVACGACEKKCPQKIPIIKQLKEVRAQFEPDEK